jgi:hypothetical protein
MNKHIVKHTHTVHETYRETKHTIRSFVPGTGTLNFHSFEIFSLDYRLVRRLPVVDVVGTVPVPVQVQTNTQAYRETFRCGKATQLRGIPVLAELIVILITICYDSMWPRRVCTGRNSQQEGNGPNGTGQNDERAAKNQALLRGGSKHCVTV